MPCQLEKTRQRFTWLVIMTPIIKQKCAKFILNRYEQSVCFWHDSWTEVGKVDVWSNINFYQFGRIKHYHDQFLSKFCYHYHFVIKLDHIHFISINFDQVWPVNHLISLSVFSRCVVSVVLTKQSTPFTFVEIGSDAKRGQHSYRLFYFLSELCFVAW